MSLRQLVFLAAFVAAETSAERVWAGEEPDLERRVRELEQRLDGDRLHRDVDIYLSRREEPPIAAAAHLRIATGTSTATDTELEEIQTGEHDPRRRGFSLQELEISLFGALGERLVAEAHVLVLLESPDDETEVELEEAFFRTRDLPVELEIGRFLVEFGRHNPLHPHAWEFVDQPVVVGAFLGSEGLRATGARIAWPGDRLRVHLGIQNPGSDSIRSLSDLAYLARVEYGESDWFIGGSAFGDAETTLWGVDLGRRMEHTRVGIELIGRGADEWGLYAQVVHELAPEWAIGVRGGWVDSDEPARSRVALLVSRRLAGAARVRFQINFDRADVLAERDHISFWLVFELGLNRGAGRLHDHEHE